jgi:hypothetical protein
MDLLTKFCPIFYLHPTEIYKPSSIEYILENSELVSNDFTILKNSPLSSLDLISSPSSSFIDISQKIIKGQSLSVAPIYGKVKKLEEYTDLTYIAVFPYNGDFNILNIQKVGEHFGDIEHVTIRLNKNNEIDSIFYGAHRIRNGRWIKPCEAEYENGRIVVYIALHGHGMYYKPYLAFRFFGFANDYMDKGERWDPKIVQIYEITENEFDKETMGWAYYEGKIGYDGIRSLSDKEWFHEGESTSLIYNPPDIYNKVFSDLFTYTMIVFYIIIISKILIMRPKNFNRTTYYLFVGITLILVISFLKWIILKVAN